MRVLSKTVFQDTVEEPKNLDQYPDIILYSGSKCMYREDADYFIDNAEVIKSLPQEYRQKIINKEPFSIEVISRKIITFANDGRAVVEWEDDLPGMKDSLSTEPGGEAKFFIDYDYLLTSIEPGVIVEAGTSLYLVPNLNHPEKREVKEFKIKTIEY